MQILPKTPLTNTDDPRNKNVRVTLQLAGGLGNQLFEYAMARRLTLRSGVGLALDVVSGFERDFYKRSFLLHHFNIDCPQVDSRHSHATLIRRIRRRIQRRLNRHRPLSQRTYIKDEERFMPGMLDLRVTRPVFIEGVWPHEDYFRDIRPTLLSDLQIRTPHEPVNLELARKIESVEAVCLHVRRLHGVPKSDAATPLAENPAQHVAATYYQRGIDAIAGRVNNPHFFVFSDFPDWARDNIRSSFPIEYITHNGAGKDYEDFWLMTQCRHFVIANSTFSWWAAWLAQSAAKQVIAPRDAIGLALASVPREWTLL
jgi:hypothetical protein